MQNVDIEISNDDVLTLRIDLKKEQGISKGGKSRRIGSTEGSVTLWTKGRPDPRNIKVSCNVFRRLTPAEKKEAARRIFELDI
ncbi:MAG: hypothetical protein FJY85_15910 [Deltaproteobacteria bacterium]|nr:hypothetical protein [Deltaproteobacteria bacterium]